MSEERRFAMIVEEGKHNFSAYSPDFPGCVATGTTVEETFQNMREAIELHLAGLKEDLQDVPDSATVGSAIFTITA